MKLKLSKKAQEFFEKHEKNVFSVMFNRYSKVKILVDKWKGCRYKLDGYMTDVKVGNAIVTIFDNEVKNVRS